MYFCGIKNEIKMNTVDTVKIERALATEMTKIAKEPVTVSYEEDQTFYCFGSELACHRIAYHHSHNYNKKVRVQYSENLKTFFAGIYSA